MYMGYKYAVSGISLLVIIPILTKKLKFKDTSVMILGSLSTMAGCVLLAFASEVWIVFIGKLRVHPMAVQYWASVADVGPILNRHDRNINKGWFNGGLASFTRDWFIFGPVSSTYITRVFNCCAMGALVQWLKHRHLHSYL